MKKKYRKPLAKFHELKCNNMMVGSGDKEPSQPSAVMRLHSVEADEWSD